MNLRACLLALAIIPLAQQSKADEGIALVGVGTTTCSEYATMYKSDPTTADTVFWTWVQGFLSGWNTAAMKKGEAPRDLGKAPEQQVQSFHSYCDRHPLSVVAQAALDLYMSLPELHR